MRWRMLMPWCATTTGLAATLLLLTGLRVGDRTLLLSLPPALYSVWRKTVLASSSETLARTTRSNAAS